MAAVSVACASASLPGTARAWSFEQPRYMDSLSTDNSGSVDAPYKKDESLYEAYLITQEPHAMSIQSALDLPIPRNLTALLQHLQRLVGREQHRFWCGGTVPVQKLGAFVNKMQDRYPIARSMRGRSYDRRRGRAPMHLVVYPLEYRWRTESGTRTCTHKGTPRVRTVASGEDQRVAWWMLAGEGVGGLHDASVPDAHVSRDAMSSDGHITVLDYVLIYAHKQEPHAVVDSSTGKHRTVYKDCSTWTWRLRSEVIRELRAQIDEYSERLEYGSELSGNAGGWGLRGLLASLRSRPLFSGVRTQVLNLHRYARDVWEPRRPLWCAMHPELGAQYGEHAGSLRPIQTILADYLPKMIRTRIYDEPPDRIADLLR